MDLNRLAELRADPEDKAALNTAITDAIHKSFQSAGMRNLTEAEVDRRVRFCVDTALMLYKDLRWEVSKIAHHIETALLCHLAGLDWSPEQVGDFYMVPGSERFHG